MSGLFNSMNAPIQVALSDMTTAITVGVLKGYVRAVGNQFIREVRASLAVVGTTLTTVDINVNGVSILSTKLTIDANEKTSVTAAAAAVLSSQALNDDDEITFDIDGAGTGAKGLIVTLIPQS